MEHSKETASEREALLSLRSTAQGMVGYMARTMRSTPGELAEDLAIFHS